MQPVTFATQKSSARPTSGCLCRMTRVATFHFRDARHCVIETVRAAVEKPRKETVPLDSAAGRVLAADVLADRDYPPIARSLRDGFAVLATGFAGGARVIGEVRAGELFLGLVGQGEAVEIMTGAPMPAGTNAVIMVEHVVRDGDQIRTDRAAKAGEFVNSRGAEARQGDVLLTAGRRLDFTGIALLASVGITSVPVYRCPEVAILSTGDEVVPVDVTPQDHQVRNSNAWSLAAQVRSSGGVPRILPVAPDDAAKTRALIKDALSSDLVLLSGGVSAGKYDFVEPALEELGAEFFFDRVLIQPGRPLVFGRVGGRYFFGLPGNPASTMVTFELFARAALELLAGLQDPQLRIFRTALTRDFRHKGGLTRFLPASISADGSALTPLVWQGSSDVTAMARANAWLVAEADHEEYLAGESIGVIPK